MKHLIVVTIVVALCVSCQQDQPDYRIVSYSSDELAQRFDDATSMAGDHRVSLKAGEDFLVLSQDQDKVYQITGPASGMLSDLMQSSDTRSFAKEYFGFIIDNLQRSNQEMQSTVYGGVSRGESIWKFREGEAIVSNMNLVDTSFIIYSTDFTLTADGAPIDLGSTTQLESLRQIEKDVRLTLLVSTHAGDKKRNLLLKSQQSADSIGAKITDFQSSQAPATALASFYLEERLYSRFDDLMGKLEQTPTALERFQ